MNEQGFLANPEEWNEDVALFLARNDQEELTALNDDHWAVINCLRRFYAEHGLAPMIRVLCKTTRLKLKYVYELFPAGPAEGACKVAGLPRADGCV